VLQETFLYVLKKFPGFTLTSNFKTFLYPAVKNMAIAARNKARRYQSTEAEMARVESTPAPPESGGPDNLRQILRRLSEEHREVLLLRFVDGLDLAEIAQAMDIPLGTVKSRLHNALATLRADPGTKKFFE
jgi:RNA polymerase sigma-70 factor (ECF subfamily)